MNGASRPASPDDIDANHDPQMDAYGLVPAMSLSLQAAGVIGMCATVVIGNSILCVLGYRRPSEESGSVFTNRLVLALAPACVITALITMPLTVATLLQFRWNYGDQACKATGVLTFVFVAMATLVLIIVFCHRCVAYLCVSDEKATKFGKNRAWLLLVFIYILCSLGCLASLIDWKAFAINPGRVLCRLANSPVHPAYRVYYGLFSAGLSVISMILFDQPRITYYNP